MQVLGDKLRQLRNDADLSLRELAKKLGDVTAAHLSDIELGRRNPSDDLMVRLAKFFDVAVDELRTFDARPPVDAIKPDTEPGLEKWLDLNTKYALVWPNITVMGEPPPDAKDWEGKPDKVKLLSLNPGGGN